MELGIVDALSEEEPRVAGMNFAAELLARGDGPRRIRDMPAPKVDEAEMPELREKVARASRGQIAQLTALDVAVKGAGLPFDEAMAAERAAFVELMQSPQRAALVHAFFAERKASRLPELDGVTPRPVKHLGVDRRRHDGRRDRRGGASERAHGHADRARRRARPKRPARGSPARCPTASSAASSPRTSARRCSPGADDGRRLRATRRGRRDRRGGVRKHGGQARGLRRLDEVAKAGAVLATNTSYLDVNEIAAATGARPTSSGCTSSRPRM
jgi:3-hydroxyacyl-CoA dehydrogenase